MTIINPDQSLSLTGKNVGWVVLTDFDGIITKQDTIKFILNRFGVPHWKTFQAQIDRGELDEVAGLESLLNCLKIDINQALHFLVNNIDIDENFYPFLDSAEARGITVGIVSSGLRSIILKLLPGIEHRIKCICAYDVSYQDGKFAVQRPGHSELNDHYNLKAATVKRYQDAGNMIAYAGDGLSDFPAAKLADVVFAKGKLLSLCRKHSARYKRFSSFRDIMNYFIELGE